MKNKKCIYIMTNPSFKEWVKIGYTDNLEKRLKDLNGSSAVPFSFHVYATMEADKPLSDKPLHNLLDMLNPELRSIEKFESGKVRKREFYAISPEEAYEILKNVAALSNKKVTRYDMSSEEIKIAKEAEAVHCKFQETLDARNRFWSELIATEVTKEDFVKAFPGRRKAGNNHWYNLPLGTTRGHISLTLNSRHNGVAVEIYIPHDKKFYKELSTHKAEINASISEDLEWQPLEGKDAARIILRNEVGDFRQLNGVDTDAAIDWLLSTAVLFKKTFAKYIKAAK